METNSEKSSSAAVADNATASDGATQTDGATTQTQEQPDDFAVFNELMQKHYPDGTPDTSDTGWTSEPTAKEPDKPSSDDTNAPAQPAPAEAGKGEPDLEVKALSDKQVVSGIEKLGIKPGEAFDAALAAYKRDGVLDEDDIAELRGKDPAKFLARGLKRAKAQRDQDAFGSEYRKWKAEQGDGTDGDDASSDDDATQVAGSDGDDQQTPAESPSPVSSLIDDALKPLTEGPDADLFGDIAKPIKTALGGVVKQLQDKYEQEIQNLRFDRVDDKLAIERMRLQRVYPDLAEDQAFERVLNRYDDVVKSEKYPTISASFAEACRWEFGGDSQQNQNNGNDEQLFAQMQQKQSRGQPRVNTGSNQNPPANVEAQERALFDRLRREHYGTNYVDAENAA